MVRVGERRDDGVADPSARETIATVPAATETDVGAGKRIETGIIHVNDQSINDEAHIPFSGTGASGVGYNSEDFLDEVTEKKWISLQHEPREFPSDRPRDRAFRAGAV